MKGFAILGCTIILLATFVVYRARTFNYCVEIAEEHLSVVDRDQSCAPNENPVEFKSAWRIQGGAGKIKTIGRMVARAFVPD